jgi:hypothetical protein
MHDALHVEFMMIKANNGRLTKSVVGTGGFAIHSHGVTDVLHVRATC